MILDLLQHKYTSYASALFIFSLCVVYFGVCLLTIWGFWKAVRTYHSICVVMHILVVAVSAMAIQGNYALWVGVFFAAVSLVVLILLFSKSTLAHFYPDR